MSHNRENETSSALWFTSIAYSLLSQSHQGWLYSFQDLIKGSWTESYWISVTGNLVLHSRLWLAEMSEPVCFAIGSRAELASGTAIAPSLDCPWVTIACQSSRSKPVRERSHDVSAPLVEDAKYLWSFARRNDWVSESECHLTIKCNRFDYLSTAWPCWEVFCAEMFNFANSAHQAGQNKSFHWIVRPDIFPSGQNVQLYRTWAHQRWLECDLNCWWTFHW